MNERQALITVRQEYENSVLNFVNKLQERDVEILNFNQTSSWYVTLSGIDNFDCLHIYFYHENTCQVFFNFTSRNKGHINNLVWPQRGLYDLSVLYGQLDGVSSKIKYNDPVNVCQSLDQMLELALRWDLIIKETNFEKRL